MHAGVKLVMAMVLVIWIIYIVEATTLLVLRPGRMSVKALLMGTVLLMETIHPLTLEYILRL